MSDLLLKDVKQTVVDQLAEMASMQGVSVEEVAKHVLEHIAIDEEEQDLIDAREAMNEPGENIPWENVKHELGLNR